MKKLKLTILAMVVLLCVTFGACAKNKPAAVVTDGETTILTNAAGKPADYSAKEVAYAAAGYLQKAQTYQVETTGSTRAKKGMIDYTQNIENLAIKNVDEAFSQSVSTSAFANVTHQAFVKTGVDKVVYRAATSGTPKVQTTADYKTGYGVIPGIDNLGGWVLNDESILYAERKDAESSKDRNVYHYVLSKTLATGKMSKQMKAFGGLKDNASFDSVELTLIVKDDFTPVSLQSVAKYDISIAVLGAMSCTQNLTSRFVDYNTQKTIPDSAAFNTAIGKDPTQEIPVPPVSDPALEGLVTSLVEYDIANGIALRGTTNLNLGGTALALPLEAGMKFDISSFDPANFASSLNLSIATDIAGMPLALHSLGDGKLYIQIGSTKSVFDLGELGLALDADSLDFGSFVKVSETETGYSVAPSRLALGILNPILNGMGMNLDRAEILFAVNNGRAASVKLDLAVSDTSGAAMFALDSEMMIGDRVYAAPDKLAFTERSLAQLAGNVLPMLNLVEHFATADWAQGQRIQLDIGVNILYDMQIPVTIDLKVNPEAASIAEMINAKIHVDLSTQGFENICSLAEMFGSPIFPTAVNYVDLYYIGDGNLYIVMGFAGDNGTFSVQNDKMVSTIALGDSLNGMIGGILMGALTSGGDMDIVAILANVVFGFTPTVDGNTTTLSASPELVSSFNTIYATLLDTLGELASAGSSMGAMLPAMLAAEFSEIDLAFTTNADGSFSGLTVDLKSESASLANDENDFVFRFSLAPSKTLENGTFDSYRAHAEAVVADAAIATPIVDEITALAPYTVQAFVGKTFTDIRLYDSVGAQIAQLKQAYADLTVDQKIMVTNYGILLEYEEIYNARRAIAQNFADLLFALDGSAESWDAVDAAYDELEAEEKDYLGYIVERYFVLRAEYEQTIVVDLNARIVAQSAALESAATQAELQAVKSALAVIKSEISKLTPEVQKSVVGYQAVLDALNDKLVQPLNSDYAALSEAVEAIDSLDTASACKTALNALNTRFVALPAAQQALITNRAAILYAFDAKVAALLNSLMPSVTTDLQALTATSPAEDVAALENKAKALSDAYGWILGAEAKASVTAYAAFSAVYPSTFDALKASAFQAKFDALKMQNAETDSPDGMMAYQVALKALQTEYNKLAAPIKALVTGFQAALNDCDARMLSVFDAHYASLTQQMNAIVANFDEAAANVLKTRVDLVTGPFYVNFFSSSNRNKFKNLNACKVLNAGAFGDAVNTPKLPALREELAVIVAAYENAVNYDEIQAYYDELKLFETTAMKGFADAMKSKFAEWVGAWEDCNARRAAAYDADLEAMTVRMLAAIESYENGETPDLDALSAMKSDADELTARHDDFINVFGSSQNSERLLSYRVFKGIFTDRFQAILYALELHA